MNMTISVIIPTYHRVEALMNCMDGLLKQSRYPDEIIFVVRSTDDDTLQALSLRNLPNQTIALVEKSGLIHALNTGVQHSTGAIVVLTDDDTIPHSDWLEKIEQHYIQRPEVGGVGGRDIVHLRGEPIPAQRQEVGVIKPYGRIIGNHHVGLGGVREVDILKGANMSYRRAAIEGLRFDENLKGTGAQVHNELEFSLSVKKQGWKLIYDPEVCVDHYPAERFDEDKRNAFNETAFLNMSHNETYSLLKHLSGARRILYVLWIIIVGSKSSPGLLQCIRMLPSQKGTAFKKAWLALKGRWGGWRTWRGSLD
ncbi:glycosyltransferase family 2 protein [Paenibacillus campinasensis]|nr:glycosyltransferase family 2 protein [Paenibacillus campinasensis]